MMFRYVVRLLHLVQIQRLVHTEQRRVMQIRAQSLITRPRIAQRHITPEHVRRRVKPGGLALMMLGQQEVIRLMDYVHSVVPRRFQSVIQTRRLQQELILRKQVQLNAFLIVLQVHTK